MFDLDKYKEIWQSISRNKVRSILTGFGVGWGLFMFIVMSGIGSGFKNGIMDSLDNVPHNSIFMYPNLTTVEYKGFNEGRYWEMQPSDIEMIKDNVPEVKYISGLVFGRNATFTRKENSTAFAIRGVDDTYIKIESYTLLQGRNINPIDIKEKRKVCIIGKNIYEQFFDEGENAVGELVSIDGTYFQVIGVMLGSDYININGNLNRTIMLPYTTVQQIYNYGQGIDMIALSAYDDVDAEIVNKKISTLLKVKHNIAPNDDEAIFAFNIAEVFNSFKSLFLGIDILIWIVGMGTLLAGVIGISNIMLVSVKERTSEIGIRRAIGAKPKSIMNQIIGESIVLTFISGFVGLFIAVLTLAGVNAIVSANASPDNMFGNPQISFNLAIISFVILLISGLFAGFLPAKNAMQIKAIDALRDE
ncbi:MAG: ABC transporter permease [Bacteroidales bacterium]|jgi:putative ABC transport system permease protein|nr:ABC transporter permease [Bacteroidales bacterium]